MENPFRRRGPLNPVDSLLTDVRSLRVEDEYLQRLDNYLTWAQQHNLSSQTAAESCIDLAMTLSQIPEVALPRQAKTESWRESRQAALAIERQPRTIAMELDPLYFNAILEGCKTFEGRAYKPDSDKLYADIRGGDMLVFDMSGRDTDFNRQARYYGLTMRSRMVCEVVDAFFSPTVHGVYQIPGFDGDAFQPMIRGDSELLQIQRAGVYYSFPGYRELIHEHGFLGIQVSKPQLIA